MNEIEIDQFILQYNKIIPMCPIYITTEVTEHLCDLLDLVFYVRIAVNNDNQNLGIIPTTSVLG